ncbi:MAG: hypothetical protein LBN25_02095 [Christensenellaceae bacterium]|jgi:hypothetical protein|nr:hypothetical protein [Christensenellaceae bacterium]
MKVKYIDYERNFGIKSCADCELSATCHIAAPATINGTVITPVYYNKRLLKYTRCGRLLATSLRYYTRASKIETERLSEAMPKSERKITEKQLKFANKMCAQLSKRYARFGH